MIKAYNESFEKYTIEDGHFNVDKKLNNQSLINISKAGVHLYDHSYVEETLGTVDLKDTKKDDIQVDITFPLHESIFDLTIHDL